MISIVIPLIWFIMLLAGLPQLSETVYTPSLPQIAKYLSVSHAMVQYTLTIYLLGFSLGTLLWGMISDRIGRRPCVIAGLIIFMIGSLGCYLSTTIFWLMVSRFVQALGGSIGSVLAQSMSRDMFHGAALGKAYAAVGTSIAIFPAIGPVVGGLIADCCGWSNIFLFLIAFALCLLAFVFYGLPETHEVTNRRKVNPLKLIKKMSMDYKVVGLALLVAGSNGISFSFFAEGSFYLIKLLGLSSTQFGLTFVPISVATMAGGLFSRRMLNHHESATVMNYGIGSICVASGLFSLIILIHTFIFPLSVKTLIGVTVVAQMANMFGKCVVAGNALALGLTKYRWCIGTASSLFGGFYYCLTSLVTFGMGKLHNHTLLPMPLYFFFIGLLLVVVRWVIDDQLKESVQ